jgi:hypothetical protein
MKRIIFILILSLFSASCEVDIPQEYTVKVDPETIKLLFDRVETLRDKIQKDIDELSKKNILRVEASAKRLQEQAKRNILEIEAQLNKDINAFVERIEEKYRNIARETFQQINRARAEALADVRYSIGFIDEKLEARITQLSLTLMEMLTRLDEIADEYKPEKWRTEVIEPTFDRLDKLAADIRQHIETLMDKVGCKVHGTTVNFTQALENVVQQLPLSKPAQKKKPCYCCADNWYCSANARDCACCQQVGLLDNQNQPLVTTDLKLFRYNVCMRKSELNENSQIQQILDSYAMIQKWAMDVYCQSDTVRVTSAELLIQTQMKKEAAQAYENYLFWSKLEN